MAGNLSRLEHIVVLMLENRSLDNMLGWLYADQNNVPPRNLPPPAAGQQPSYDGLVANHYFNLTDLQHPAQARQVFATRGTRGAAGCGPFNMPNPDPAELFDNMNFQIFGTKHPAANQQATMNGFIVDYQTARDNTVANADTIMQSYSPEQVTAISGLARNYAVSDRWFASSPTQTLPNRAFVHAGTSLGRVNDFILFEGLESLFGLVYDTKTIFNVLHDAGISWGIYCGESAGDVPISMTLFQLRQLWNPIISAGRVSTFARFQEQAADGSLPAYSFLEPRWLEQPTDQLPPHDVCAGDRYIADVYNAVRTGRNWDRTLLIVMYDENGGTYDHVPTVYGATPPDAKSDPGEEGFGFRRFGVRVPAVFVSPWIAPGTVFRSPTGVPFDHSSVPATILDWKGISRAALPSARVAAAPSFEEVLSLAAPRADAPAITASCATGPVDNVPLHAPPNKLQQVIALSATYYARGHLSAHEFEAFLFSLISREAIKDQLASLPWPEHLRQA
jgi:phospholipase C